MWFLGGHTITRTGWAGARAVFVEFRSVYDSAWVWQLYAGRRRIGSTLHPAQRRVVGQLVIDEAPAPLTLIRVDPANRLTDYGAELPPVPWNRFALEWSADGFPADTSRFVLTASVAAGEPADPAHILAEPPYSGDQEYRYLLPPLARSGVWTYRITPHDDALPLGNAGTPVEVQVTAAVPPPDVVPRDSGERFGLNVAAGVLTVSFEYGD